MNVPGLPCDTAYYLQPGVDVDPRIVALCQYIESQHVAGIQGRKVQARLEQILFHTYDALEYVAGEEALESGH